jgi:hypothetical protein
MNMLLNSKHLEISVAPSRYTYAGAIQDLQKSGCLSLADIQELSLFDLNCLCEEIKSWCVYGNHDPKKLRSSTKKLL